eukprot:2434879-Prymnesium_polylepis.1
MTTRTMRHCCANRTPAFRLGSTTAKRRSSHVPAPSKNPEWLIGHRNPAHRRGVPKPKLCIKQGLLQS